MSVNEHVTVEVDSHESSLLVAGAAVVYVNWKQIKQTLPRRVLLMTGVLLHQASQGLEMGVSCLSQVPLCFDLETVPDWPGESPAWSPTIDNLLCTPFWSEPHYVFSIARGGHRVDHLVW